MPLSRYNAAFGGKRGSAQKAYSSMVSQYGAEKGKQVFYATKNKRSKSKRSARQEELVRRFQRRHGGKGGRSQR